MKKFKFSTSVNIFLYVMLVVVLSSCRESRFPETPSKFVVERIEPNKTKGTSLYLARPIEQKDI